MNQNYVDNHVLQNIKRYKKMTKYSEIYIIYHRVGERFSKCSQGWNHPEHSSVKGSIDLL